MPRPRKCRWIRNLPEADYFKPRGIPIRRLREVVLSVEGYEALRLAEVEGVSREEAAKRMKISRHTFGRVLAEARRVVAEAVVRGWALRIDGGHYVIESSGAQNTGIGGDANRSQKCGSGKETPARVSREELNMAKIAVSSEGPTLEDRVDPRFGRAAGFVLIDPQTQAVEYLDNGTSQALARGAGIQAAERVADAGAKVVLTGYVGPKAFQALAAAGIQVGQDLGGMTVQEALDRFQSGQVEMASGPNR